MDSSSLLPWAQHQATESQDEAEPHLILQLCTAAPVTFPARGEEDPRDNKAFMLERLSRAQEHRRTVEEVRFGVWLRKKRGWTEGRPLLTDTKRSYS